MFNMKGYRWLCLALGILLLAACQAHSTVRPVTILDGGQVHHLRSSARLPSLLLEAAGVSLAPADRLLYLGKVLPLDQPLPEAAAFTLQVSRAISFTVKHDNQSMVINSSAGTIGEALVEAGFTLYIADRFDPPADTPLNESMEVLYRPSRVYIVTVGRQDRQIRSAAATVGQALAEAGIPLQGLDYSLPPEDEALPEDGRIRVVRVRESVALVQKPLAFQSEFQASADLELDQQEILQNGEYGLTMRRERVRYEDGVETSRRVESESILHAPQTQIIGFGTKIIIRTMDTPNGPIEYWRAVLVYATAYSPCRLGIPGNPNYCNNITFSGKKMQTGYIAVLRKWYYEMAGQRIYVPGYGIGQVEDVGAGFPDRHWLDLGFTDADFQPWHRYVMAYFLTPVPNNILYILP